MTLWKTERIFSPLPAQGVQAGPLAVAVLAVIGAAPALLLLCLVPLPLVLPVLSIVSFAIAGVVALVAHYCGIDRRTPGVSAWDIVAVFTLIWIGAGMTSGAKPLVELFDRLAMTP